MGGIRLLKKLLSRTAITAVLILAQLVWIAALVLRLGDALPVLNYILRILSLIAILHVIKNDMDPSSAGCCLSHFCLCSAALCTSCSGISGRQNLCAIS